MGAPATYNITFVAGDGYSLKFSFFRKVNGVKIARDISDSDFLSQIRRRPDSDEVLATFAQTRTADNMDLDTNQLVISLQEDETAAVARDAVWDIQETEDGGQARTKFSGKVKVIKDVSREEDD